MKTTLDAIGGNQCKVSLPAVLPFKKSKFLSISNGVTMSEHLGNAINKAHKLVYERIPKMYVKDGVLRCPACGSYGGSLEINTKTNKSKFICRDCDRKSK